MQPSILESAQAMPALDLLRVMELSRQGDRREGILLRQSRGWFQVAGMGHEALAAMAYHLRPDDYLFPYYRDRALCLARGLTNYELALAYFARQESSSAGRQMPGHYSSRRLNIFSAATPTASQCLPAAGAAWGMKLDRLDSVVVCSVGDAAIRQGEFAEAVAFALQEDLPLVLVVEDNQYGISTPTLRHNPYRLGVFNEKHVVRVDARDPQQVFAHSGAAIAKARQGGGPTVLWCEVDRLCSHTSSDDHRVYRTQDCITEMQLRDPIPVLAKRLVDAGALTESEWEAYQRQVAEQVEEDYRRAEEQPEAPPDSALDCLYAVPCREATPVEAPPVRPAENAITMVGAINDTLKAALAGDDRVVMLGEDIADPKGGVFGLTKGLSTAHPNRVFNSPLAEATIVGVAVGLAATGWRPVFELQFVDFVTPALNQLHNQVATLRWRSAGDWSCPLTLIAPAGAYLPGGSLWHSQTNEGMFAHIPGLRVAMPSTPADAAGLLWTAIRGDDPTLFLVPKHVFRKRIPVPDVLPAVPYGESVVRREGTDVTLVTWGNCVELSEQAADQVSAEGTSVEIVDLRSIAPCDWDGVAASIAKTGRLVVVHEDIRTGGFGQAVVAEMTAHPERWNSFLAPPQIVARLDVHVPFCPSLEYAVLPDVEGVVAAIHTVME